MEQPDRALTDGPRAPRYRPADIPWGYVALLALTAVISDAPWLGAYSSHGAAAAIGAASVISLAVSVGAARVLRWSPQGAFALSACALVVLLLVESALRPSAVVDALVHGPGRLLTETLPLGGASTATPVVVVCWVVGAATGEMAARTGRRSQLSGLALGVPVIWFVASLGVTAPAPGANWLDAPLLLVSLAAAAFARHDTLERVDRLSPEGEAVPPAVQRIPRWIAGCAVLSAVLATVVPNLPGAAAPPAAVSELPAAQPALIVNPVAVTGAERDGDTSTRGIPVLRVHISGPSDGYLTAAVLDRYDGSEWTFDTTFDPTGGRIPMPSGYLPPVFDSATVRSSTTLLRRPPVPLLPVVGRPLGISGMTVAADTLHGMVVPDQAYRLPARFQAVSITPLVTLLSLPPAEGIGEPPPASGADQAAGGVPPDIEVPPEGTTAVATAARFLGAITGVRPSPTVAFLQQAIAAIGKADKRIIAVRSASGTGPTGGTSLSEVINAVTVDRSATPEEFATFVAMVARYLGIPAVVVTGYRLRPSAAGGQLAGGSYTVSDTQAWTWVEVPVSGLGWLVVDPTPAATTGQAAPPPEQVQAPSSTVAPQRANAVPKAGVGGHAVAKPVNLRARSGGGVPAWALGLLAAAGFMAALLAAGPGLAEFRRRRRRRARASPDPAMLASGAWLELLDGLSRAGMDVREGSTSSEIAGEAGDHFGEGVPNRVMEVGAVADRAVCSVLDPPDADAALGAWNAQRDLQGHIFSGLDRRQRMRALMRTGVTAKRAKTTAGER